MKTKSVLFSLTISFTAPGLSKSCYLKLDISFLPSWKNRRKTGFPYFAIVGHLPDELTNVTLICSNFFSSDARNSHLTLCISREYFYDGKYYLHRTKKHNLIRLQKIKSNKLTTIALLVRWKSIPQSAVRYHAMASEASNRFTRE